MSIVNGHGQFSPIAEQPTPSSDNRTPLTQSIINISNISIILWLDKFSSAPLDDHRSHLVSSSLRQFTREKNFDNMPSANQKPRTLYDKVFEAHIVDERDDGTILLYIGKCSTA